MSNAAKSCDILATSLSVVRNCFDQQNYFSDLHPVKILDLSAKPFFPCKVCGSNLGVRTPATRRRSHLRVSI